MRKLILSAALVLGIPAVGAAAPCLPASLADYIGLASGGCTIGGALFADFSSVAAPGATAIDEALISVDPLNLGFGFGLNVSAAAGEVFGNGIGYRVSGLSFIGRSLSMEGSTVVEDGALTALQFGPGPPLVVFDIGLASDLFEETAFPPVSFFDVFTEITIDGGPPGTSGSAELDGRVVDRFAVPEPVTVLLLGSGLLGLAARRRRQPAR